MQWRQITGVPGSALTKKGRPVRYDVIGNTAGSISESFSSPAAYLESINTALRAIVIGLGGMIPAGDIRSIWELIDAGEPDVALGNLCTQLYEYDAAVPGDILIQITGVGEAMQLAPNHWLDLTVESW